MTSDINNMPQHTVKDLVRTLGDMVLAVHGDENKIFVSAENIDRASPGAMSFCKYSGKQAVDMIASSEAGVVICGVLDDVNIFSRNVVVISTTDARKAFVRAVAAFFSPARLHGIHPTAVIDPDAVIHSTAYIGPHVVLGACVVGANTEIHANVVVYKNTRIGENVTINSGTVIGADGFGYERDVDGSMTKFIHLGGVLIEDNVEIGTNTSIDRGTLGNTIIERGVKIDNQIHIAHNCHIRENAVVIAQSMVGGSVTIGARAWVAPGVVIMNGITLGDDSYCGLGAIVTKSVKDGETVMGNPARPLAEAKALLAAQKKLVS